MAANLDLLEVPIITPDHDEMATRYTIQNDLTFHQTIEPSPAPIWQGNEEEWQGRIQGCAATKCTSDNSIIRTAACIEEPYVLSIAKTDGSDLSMVEIDMSHLDATYLTDVIATFIFQETQQSHDQDAYDMDMDTDTECPVVKIILVDSQANVLTLTFDKDSLGPIQATHVSTRSIMSSRNIHSSHRTGLTTTQVAAINSNRLVFALTPYIVCLNLESQLVALWFRESCLYNRKKSLSNVLKSAKGILVGKSVDEADEFIEQANTMASTAALCCFDMGPDEEEEEEDDGPVGKVVCSLHSDGTVRMWTVGMYSPTFTYPKQMYLLHSASEVEAERIMPMPHSWSSSSDSLLMNGRSKMSIDGRLNFDLVIAIKVAEGVGQSRASSPLHMVKLFGSASASNRSHSVEKRSFKIPRSVDSIKAIEFKGDEPSICALFSCIEEDEANSTMSLYSSFSHVPHRVMSIAVYSLASMECSQYYSSNIFDNIETKNRNAIQSICKMMLKNEFTLWSDMDDATTVRSTLDRWFLKKIFRSNSICTNGVSDGSVRRALLQVLPPLFMSREIQSHDSRKGIEMETLRMMTEWSKCDESRSKSQDGPKTTSTTATMVPSIYNDFCNSPDSDSAQTPEMGDDSDDDEILSEQDLRMRQIHEHVQRWTKLVEAIVEEEAKALSPLSLAVTPSNSTFEESLVIVRAGMSSVVQCSKEKSENSIGKKLDSSILSMYANISKNKGNLEKIACFAAKTFEMIAAARFLYDDDKNTFIEYFNGTLSSIEADGWEKLYSKVLHFFNTMSNEDVVSWLTSPVTDLYSGTSMTGNIKKSSTTSIITPNAVKLTKYNIASSNDLALIRFICITGLGLNGFKLFSVEQERVALVTYLQSVGVSWTLSQRIPSQNASSSSIANKKDVIETYVAKVVNTLEMQNIFPTTMEASIAILEQAYSQSLDKFHELELVSFLEDEIMSKRMALRLLSPLVSFPSSEDNFRCRKFIAADCLLEEISILIRQKGINVEKASEMLEHASTLLKSTFSIPGNPSAVHIFLEVLRSCNPEHENVPENFFEESITTFFRDGINSYSIAFGEDDIRNIVWLGNIKSMLRPWVVMAYQNKCSVHGLIIKSLQDATSDADAVLQHTFIILVNLSNLVRRVSILERHYEMINDVSLDGTYARVLNSAVNAIIEEVQSHLEAEDFSIILDFSSLWSSIFRFSLQGRCWEDAIEACLSHPTKSRQGTNFRRLVLAMADEGSFGILLDKIIFMILEDNGSGKSIDLYEEAATALIEASQRSVTDFSFGSATCVDYRSCLYSLYASYNEWRECTQAMDLYGALALGKVQTNFEEDENEMSENGNSEKDAVNYQVMKELTLSGVASAQFIELVDNSDQRYIISGETSSSHILGGMDEKFQDHTSSRLSRLYKYDDLCLRAQRLIAIQTIQMDGFSPENLVDVLQSSDTMIIDALAQLGYYEQAIEFAKCKRMNKKGAKLQGRDVFDDAISHILCECLAPVAMQVSTVEGEGLHSRPTLKQLRLLVGDGRLPKACDSWETEYKQPLLERANLAMNLLRIYTEMYSNEVNTLAIEVAGALLELGEKRVKLPSWLTSVILGKSISGLSGLFAKNGGNATALLDLYMEYGLYIDACDLVISILIGDEKERQKNATNRLPEKGYVDFVPYEKIDNLWNSIEELSEEHGEQDLERLLLARSQMEVALEKYYKLMKVSEQGMMSARALSS